VEHDIDVERDWKLFIKNLDPEKKTAQACFTSLVYVSPLPIFTQRGTDVQASRAPICPRHHVHRAGPSVQIPRAFRHYDTSDARTTRRTRTVPRFSGPGATRVQLDDQGGTEAAINAMAQMDAGIPERQLTHFQNWHNPALENTISENEQDGRDAQTQAVPQRERNLFRQLFDDLTSQDAEEADEAQEFRNAQNRIRASHGLPESSRSGHEGNVERRPLSLWQPGDLMRGMLNPHRASGFSLDNRSDDTPVSLSGARGSRTLRRFGLPASSSSDIEDTIPIDTFDPLTTTYPLFAPYDDAGPYPMEDMFDTDHDHEDEEDDDAGAVTIFPSAGPDTLGMQGRGYEDWGIPIRPFRSGLPDTDRDPTNIIDTPESPYEVVGSPDYTLGPASPNAPGPGYTARARAEVDEQLALDLEPGIPQLAPVDQDQLLRPVWTFMPAMRRRQREMESDEDQVGEGGDDERRPARRPRTDEEGGSGPVEGAQQRVRRSIPVESLLSGSASGSGSGDNRRNGLVFDAESYINPNL